MRGIRMGLAAGIGAFLLGGCCLPSGGGGGGTPPPPAPLLSVATSDPGGTTCVEYDTANPNYSCDGDVVVTVTNIGTASTTAPVVIAIDTENDGGQGTCAGGNLLNGASCTATIRVHTHHVPGSTTITGTATATVTADSLTASAPFSLAGTVTAGQGG